MVGETGQYMQPVPQPVEEGLFDNWSWGKLATWAFWAAAGTAAVGAALYFITPVREFVNKTFTGDKTRGIGSDLSHSLFGDFYENLTNGKISVDDSISETTVYKQKIPVFGSYWENTAVIGQDGQENLNYLKTVGSRIKETRFHPAATAEQERKDIRNKEIQAEGYIRNAEAWDNGVGVYKVAFDKLTELGHPIDSPTFGINKRFEATLTEHDRNVLSELDSDLQSKSSGKLSTIEKVLRLNDILTEQNFPVDDFKNKGTSYWGVRREKGKGGFDGVWNNKGEIIAETTAAAVWGAAIPATTGVGAVISPLSGTMSAVTVGIGSVAWNALGLDGTLDMETALKGKIQLDIKRGDFDKANEKIAYAKEFFTGKKEKNTDESMGVQGHDDAAYTSFVNIENYVAKLSKRDKLLPVLEKAFSVGADSAVRAKQMVNEYNQNVEAVKKVEDGKETDVVKTRSALIAPASDLPAPTAQPKVAVPVTPAAVPSAQPSVPPK